MTAMRTIFLPDRQYTYYLGATLNRAGNLRYRKNDGDRLFSSGLFLLWCLQHLLAGGGELRKIERATSCFLKAAEKGGGAGGANAPEQFVGRIGADRSAPGAIRWAQSALH